MYLYSKVYNRNRNNYCKKLYSTTILTQHYQTKLNRYRASPFERVLIGPAEIS